MEAKDVVNAHLLDGEHKDLEARVHRLVKRAEQTRSLKCLIRDLWTIVVCETKIERTDIWEEYKTRVDIALEGFEG
jgi:hypothetical protein